MDFNGLTPSLNIFLSGQYDFNQRCSLSTTLTRGNSTMMRAITVFSKSTQRDATLDFPSFFAIQATGAVVRKKQQLSTAICRCGSVAS